MSVETSITCAVEVFVATCLLHREQTERVDFTVKEIVERARQENLYGRLRPGVQVHASVHCVANRAPNMLTSSMLYATGKSTRRLIRRGDEVFPGRSREHWPAAAELPDGYRWLPEFARAEYAKGVEDVERRGHPLLRLVGLGAQRWTGVDADEYVRGLREGWE